MKTTRSAQRVADIILTGIEDANIFILHLLIRLSHPLIALGLIYLVERSLPYSPIPVLPYWEPAWTVIQAVAITGHLAILPYRAIEQHKAKDYGNLALTIISIALLTVSAVPLSVLPLIRWFYSSTFTTIRVLTLVSILFTKPVTPRKPFININIPATSVQISPKDEQDDDYTYPFGPTCGDENTQD